MRLPRRFDSALMVPPDCVAAAGGGAGAGDAALLASLRAWCERGAFPALTEPLSMSHVVPHAGLDSLACELDGSHQLARLGRWRGLWWRLQILWRECVAGPTALPPQEPWDCGWWREGALEAAAAFRPRRPTLLMVRDTEPATVKALLAALQSGSKDYAQALRVVVVSATRVPD